MSVAGLLPAAVLGMAYAYGVATAGRPWPWWRTASAMGAVALLAVALGPLDGAADRHLADHMAQHAVVGALAPALLALSAPVRLALAAPSRRRRRAIASVLHARAARLLLRPEVAVPLAGATVALLHLPGVMDAVERDPTLHALDHAALFWTATLAWATLLGADPVPAAPGPVGVLVAAAAWMVPMALVGAVYANADHLLVGAYAAVGDTVADQRDAGTIMILGGPLLLAPFALGAAARGLWLEEDRQRRRERAEGLR
ncbi:MAG TPA: cytochrome c oxidase assembly protein [Baekduia sp.]|uniref:cytochrome c oxidase assembly protein n=1 Tax=Baekduia sp. TaxID=2600305 RepID=UPI002D76D536|nr:cytochrome c oxidase assembly protein [Baekduia sp.]HET6506065.1 cytochrome c oxidase assembly protein [Baekduia sp.]